MFLQSVWGLPFIIKRVHFVIGEVITGNQRAERSSGQNCSLQARKDIPLKIIFASKPGLRLTASHSIQDPPNRLVFVWS